MVALVRQVRDKQSFCRLPHAAKFGRVCRRIFSFAVGKVFGSELVHPVADFPRIPALERFFHPNWADGNPVGEVLSLFTGVESDASVVAEKERLEVVNIGVVDVGIGAVSPSVGKFIVVVVRIHKDRQAHLFQIASAQSGVCLCFGFGQRGQKHSGKNGDDGDDNEKLDEGKSKSASIPMKKNWGKHRASKTRRLVFEKQNRRKFRFPLASWRCMVYGFV